MLAHEIGQRSVADVDAVADQFLVDTYLIALAGSEFLDDAFPVLFGSQLPFDRRDFICVGRDDLLHLRARDIHCSCNLAGPVLKLVQLQYRSPRLLVDHL